MRWRTVETFEACFRRAAHPKAAASRRTPKLALAGDELDHRALRRVGVQVLDPHLVAFAQTVDQRDAGGFQSCRFGIDVVHAQTEVIDARAAVRQQPHHRLLGVARFDELELGIADAHTAAANRRLIARFDRTGFEAERLCIEAQRRIEIGYQDADVIDLHDHRVPPPRSRSICRTTPPTAIQVRPLSSSSAPHTAPPMVNPNPVAATKYCKSYIALPGLRSWNICAL